MTAPGKKIYFASDFHLGAPDMETSRNRERLIVSWLDSIIHDADELYLMGDIFDFWFEYRRVAPKGFVRLLGKLAEFTDRGIPLHIFTGNHDLWMWDYLKEEVGAVVYYKPIIREIDGKSFYLAHGDGLGPGDLSFKAMKRVFSNRVSQWLFARIHPNTAFDLAYYFSRRSRKKTGKHDAIFLGEDREWLIIHSRNVLKTRHIDYFIYGHRHHPLLLELAPGSKYLNLGDWLNNCTYGVWDGKELKLEYFRGN